MYEVTDFGDLAVLVPLSVAILLWLVAVRCSQAIVPWCASLALCLGGTASLKIYFFACPVGSDLVNPSGHTSFSTLIYGALAVVVAAQLTGTWQRIAAIGVGAALPAMIALSRLAIRAHSLVEIILGIGLGLASLALFTRAYLRCRPAYNRLSILVVPVIIIMIMIHGRQLGGEEFLHTLGRYLPLRSFACGCAELLP